VQGDVLPGRLDPRQVHVGERGDLLWTGRRQAGPEHRDLGGLIHSRCRVPYTAVGRCAPFKLLRLQPAGAVLGAVLHATQQDRCLVGGAGIALRA